MQNLRLFEKFESEDANFCAVDNDDCNGNGHTGVSAVLMAVGVYVDLVENPERFTDYSGPSAHRIWSAIYNEDYVVPDLKHIGATREWYSSEERRLFYRIVSGTAFSHVRKLSSFFRHPRLYICASERPLLQSRYGSMGEQV